jgi:type VI secretion system protein ImpK
MNSGLVDHCGDLVRLALYLGKDAAGLDAGALGERFDALFRNFEDRAHHAGAPMAMVQLSKYALVAFIDQQVLTSELTVKEAWLEQPLQMRYFDQSTAGEDFYNKLDELRQGNEPGRIDAMEVFYLCMVLGFTGKFSDTRGLEQRKILMDRIAREILEARPGSSGPIAPHGLEPATAAPAAGNWVQRLPVWIPPAVAAAILIATWLVVSLVLGSSADAFPALSFGRGGGS